MRAKVERVGTRAIVAAERVALRIALTSAKITARELDRTVTVALGEGKRDQEG